METPYLRQLVSFQPEEETISVYLERTNIFFQANKITEDQCKVTVFLNPIGARTYTLLRDLLSLAVLTDKTFTELCTTLKGHFQPKPIVITERFQFHQWSQDFNKLVAGYIAELRKLTLHCEFGKIPQGCFMRSVSVQPSKCSCAEATVSAN